jgi:hypothetical protein
MTAFSVLAARCFPRVASLGTCSRGQPNDTLGLSRSRHRALPEPPDTIDLHTSRDRHSWTDSYSRTAPMNSFRRVRWGGRKYQPPAPLASLSFPSALRSSYPASGRGVTVEYKERRCPAAQAAAIRLASDGAKAQHEPGCLDRRLRISDRCRSIVSKIQNRNMLLQNLRRFLHSLTFVLAV